MKKFDVVIALEKVRDARAEWAKAQTGFTADISTVMRRLVNEAAVNYMSPEEVAKASGLTVSRVRQIMRDNNLNPRNSRSLLAKTAASTLAENAALLGIEPRDFDLTSPLAYLPMGSELKAFMGASVTAGDLDDTVLVRIDRETWDDHQKNGECPVSAGCCGCHLDFAVQA